MSNEDQFKNKVRDLVNEKQFRYEPSNWEQISNTLDKQDRKKKWLYLSVIAGMVTGVMCVILMTNKYHVPYTLLTSTQTKKGNQLKKENEVKWSYEKSENSTKSSENKTNTTQKISGANYLTQSKEIYKYNLVKKTRSAIQTYTPVAGVKVSILSLPEKGAAEDQINKGTSEENFNLNINNSVTENQSKAEPNMVYEQSSGLMNLETNRDNDQAPEVLRKQENGSIRNNTPTNKLVFENKESKESTLNLERINILLLNKDTTTTILSLQLQNVDSSGKFISKEETPKNLSMGFFLFEVGSYFNSGWKYNTKQEAQGFNFYTGLSYSIKLTPKMNLFIGTYYAPVSHLKASKKIVTNYDFVFGERNEITVISPLTLNYIQAPLTLQYLLANNHGLSIGYAFNYLLDVRSKVDTYTEELHTTFDKNSFKTFGYTDGFAKVSSSLIFGYRIKISKSIWINNQLHFGLTELRKDDFLKNEQKEKSRGIVVSLNYYFFNK